MNFSASTFLVTTVFATQILVLSVLVPYQFRRACSRLKERYPAREYPRLYPVGPAEVVRFNAILAVVRLVIVLTGTTLFGVDLVEGRDPADLAHTMLCVLLAQTVPAFVRLRWELRMARAFRTLPAPPVRSAELRPSRLSDFVPLPLVVAGLAGVLVSLVSAIALYGTHLARLRIAAVIVLAYSGWTSVRMLIALKAPGSTPRPDPYMTDADVFRARRLWLRNLFVGAAVVGAVLAVILLFLAGRLPVDFVAIQIGASILSQLGYLGYAQAVLRTLAVRDASVYRAEAT